MTRRTKVLLTLWCAAIPVIAAAQKTPNFSGTWKCDVARSVGCADASIAVINHDATTLTMTMGAGKGPSAVYRIGQTVTTTPNPDRPSAVSQGQARWNGDVLVTEITATEPENRTVTSTWRLSADGKELTIDVKRTGSNVRPSSKYVYVKTQ